MVKNEGETTMRRLLSTIQKLFSFKRSPPPSKPEFATVDLTGDAPVSIRIADWPLIGHADLFYRNGHYELQRWDIRLRKCLTHDRFLLYARGMWTSYDGGGSSSAGVLRDSQDHICGIADMALEVCRALDLHYGLRPEILVQDFLNHLQPRVL